MINVENVENVDKIQKAMSKLTEFGILALQEKENREAKYLEIIKYILDKMKIDTDRQPYQTELHDATAISWKGHLSRHKIPGEDLLSLYDDAVAYRAMTDRRNPFCIEDMLSAWFRLQQKRADTPHIRKSVQLCTKCDEFGVVRIPQKGRMIEISCNHED